MEIIGRQIEFGVSVEQTRGTPQSTAEKWLRNVTCNIQEKAEHVIDDNSHGKLADSDNRRVTKKWVEGNLEGILDVDFIGYLFYNLFGSITSTWQAAGVYEHELTTSESIEHASLGLFVKDGGVQQIVAAGGMVGNLEINAAPDNYVRFSSAIMARSASDNSDTPSYGTQYDFIGKDVTIKVADTEAGLVGATATKVKEFNINFDQGGIMDYVLGSFNPDDIYNSKMSIEGSLSKNFDAETFKDLYLGDSAKYMEITIEGSQNIGGGNYPTITILLNEVKITGWERSGGNDELVVENIEFKAFWNDSDSQQAKVTIKNNTAEYDSAPSA